MQILKVALALKNKTAIGDAGALEPHQDSVSN